MRDHLQAGIWAEEPAGIDLEGRRRMPGRGRKHGRNLLRVIGGQFRLHFGVANIRGPVVPSPFISEIYRNMLRVICQGPGARTAALAHCTFWNRDSAEAMAAIEAGLTASACDTVISVAA